MSSARLHTSNIPLSNVGPCIFLFHGNRSRVGGQHNVANHCRTVVSSRDHDGAALAHVGERGWHASKRGVHNLVAATAEVEAKDGDPGVGPARRRRDALDLAWSEVRPFLVASYHLGAGVRGEHNCAKLSEVRPRGCLYHNLIVILRDDAGKNAAEGYLDHLGATCTKSNARNGHDRAILAA